MKHLLLAPLLLLIPSVQAVDYVECEAIRNAISRISSSKSQAERIALNNWAKTKTTDLINPNWDQLHPSSKDYLVKGLQTKVLTDPQYKKERTAILSKVSKPFAKNLNRAERDYKKKGCI